jgi:hypothetical protein
MGDLIGDRRHAAWAASVGVIVVAACGSRAALESGDLGQGAGHESGGHAATTTSDGAAGVGGTTTTTLTVCDDVTDDCGHCVVDCANAIHGPCRALKQLCLADPVCSAFQDCMGSCGLGFDACMASCDQAHPGGGSKYYAEVSCIFCEQCRVNCSHPYAWVTCSET